MHNPATDWCYKTEPCDGLAGRSIDWPRGRVLGGSSSINGLIYIRGQREDFDHWRQLGNAGWSYEDVLPYFKRARSEEHTSELQSLMRISYAVFCLKKKKKITVKTQLSHAQASSKTTL